MGKGVFGGCFSHIRWYFPLLRVPDLGPRWSSSSSEDSSSDEHGEKNDRTADEPADGSSRNEIPVMGVLTANNGGGIART
jgi:hypothetical protein